MGRAGVGARHLLPVAVALRLSGLWMRASRTLTIWEKRGRWALSLCQQSSMSWCRARGQPMGAGRRYPSSTELMTWRGGGQAQSWAGGRPPPLRPTPTAASPQPGSRTHVTVCHVPVGPLPVGQHLPHDHTEAPHVAGRGEGPESDGLRGRPADWDLASLQDMRKCPGLLPARGREPSARAGPGTRQGRSGGPTSRCLEPPFRSGDPHSQLI